MNRPPVVLTSLQGIRLDDSKWPGGDGKGQMLTCLLGSCVPDLNLRLCKQQFHLACCMLALGFQMGRSESLASLWLLHFSYGFVVHIIRIHGVP